MIILELIAHGGTKFYSLRGVGKGKEGPAF